jgi:hypothetical protein
MKADTRLYACAIALVSGIYSIASTIAGGMGRMPMGASVMLLLGIVVVVHGIVLLTPLAGRLVRPSGPLMIVWAVIMLANQLLTDTMSRGPMMAWDAGMVAVAVLMLASGVIMSRRGEPM